MSGPKTAAGRKLCRLLEGTVHAYSRACAITGARTYEELATKPSSKCFNELIDLREWMRCAEVQADRMMTHKGDS